MILVVGEKLGEYVSSDDELQSGNLSVGRKLVLFLRAFLSEVMKGGGCEAFCGKLRYIVRTSFEQCDSFTMVTGYL